MTSPRRPVQVVTRLGVEGFISQPERSRARAQFLAGERRVVFGTLGLLLGVMITSTEVGDPAAAHVLLPQGGIGAAPDDAAMLLVIIAVWYIMNPMHACACAPASESGKLGTCEKLFVGMNR